MFSTEISPGNLQLIQLISHRVQALNTHTHPSALLCFAYSQLVHPLSASRAPLQLHCLHDTVASACRFLGGDAARSVAYAAWMPKGHFTTDLESGLPADTGPWSGAGVGCADCSWSALRCTLAVAEEAARQLHLCVAWVSEESQRDFEAWSAAKKDDDLFGPLRPAPKQQNLQDNNISAPAYAAAPALQAEFSRLQQAVTPNAQPCVDVHKVTAAVLRISLDDESGDRFTASSPVWEDFKCSPTQPQHSGSQGQDHDVMSAAGVTINSSHARQKGHTNSMQVSSPLPLRLPGMVAPTLWPCQLRLHAHHAAWMVTVQCNRG